MPHVTKTEKNRKHTSIQRFCNHNTVRDLGLLYFIWLNHDLSQKRQIYNFIWKGVTILNAGRKKYKKNLKYCAQICYFQDFSQLIS